MFKTVPYVLLIVGCLHRLAEIVNAKDTVPTQPQRVENCPWMLPCRHLSTTAAKAFRNNVWKWSDIVDWGFRSKTE
jgi:hypothetical protein